MVEIRLMRLANQQLNVNNILKTHKIETTKEILGST